MDKYVDIIEILVDNHLLLAKIICVKVVENEIWKILAGKDIVTTLDIPSERYSRQTQKSVKVVMQHLRSMYSKELGSSDG